MFVRSLNQVNYPPPSSVTSLPPLGDVITVVTKQLPPYIRFMKGKSNQPQATSSTATCRHRRRRHKTSEYNMKGNEDVTLFKRETETQYGNETQYREKPINIIYKLTCRQPCSGRNYTAQYFIRMYPSMAVFKSKLRDLITTIMFTSSNDHLTPRMVESIQHMQQPFHADTIDFSVPSWTFVVWFLCFTGTHSRSTQY